MQGDTGHAQARMVTDLYAHTNDEERRRLAQKMERDFFSKKPAGDSKKAADDDITAALELLKENPAIAKILIAAMQK